MLTGKKKSFDCFSVNIKSNSECLPNSQTKMDSKDSVEMTDVTGQEQVTRDKGFHTFGKDSVTNKQH